VVLALDPEMKAEVDDRVLLADGPALLVERRVKPRLVADVQEHRGHAARSGGQRLGVHVLVVRIVHAEVAVRIDDAGHEHTSFGVDRAPRLGERIVRSGERDASIRDRYTPPEFPVVGHHAGIAYDEIDLHARSP